MRIKIAFVRNAERTLQIEEEQHLRIVNAPPEAIETLLRVAVRSSFQSHDKAALNLSSFLIASTCKRSHRKTVTKY